MKILVSAGEASGDLYASALVEALRRRIPDARFFGCTGPRMRAAGVETVVDAADLNVVGIVEVVRDIPRIWGEFRKLVAAAERERPSLAILTDAPDFHLRLAPKLKRLGVPVVYLVAPQAWAWRKGRIPAMRRHLDRLLCIFPFEEAFFRGQGVQASYIGHPLVGRVRPSLTGAEFRAKHFIPGAVPEGTPLVTLLPGSRPGEIARHLGVLAGTARLISARREAAFLLATPAGLSRRTGFTFFTEPFRGQSIQHVEGETWDAIAHADLALAASGTVTIEAAILGTPMVSYYRVSPWSWWMGRFLVKVPFFTMVNLVAGRKLVPELIQTDCTAGRLAEEALSLLDSPAALARMKEGLAEVTRLLSIDRDPMERAADVVLGLVKGS